jgi:hypothetical protein
VVDGVATSLTTARGPAERMGAVWAGATAVVWLAFGPTSMGQIVAESELIFSASTAPRAPRHPTIARPPTMTAVRIHEPPDQNRAARHGEHPRGSSSAHILIGEPATNSPGYALTAWDRSSLSTQRSGFPDTD